MAALPSAAAGGEAEAASCADEMMQRMLDDGSGQKGMEAVADRTPNVSGGDLLKALGPIGPPLSLAPGDGNVKSESVKGSNPSESRKEESVLGVKRVEVREVQQSGNPGSHDGAPSNSAPTVSDSGVERGSRDVTGRGKGSGFTGTGVDPRLVGASVGGPQSVETSGTRGSGGVERFYIGDKPPELEQGGQVGSRLGDVVNPFWSQGVQKEVIRETFGAGYEVGTLGVQQSSNSSTPQKVLKRDDYVEMDAIELFRLRCLREAEEKFRRGIMNMECSRSTGGVQQDPEGFQGSQCSFMSVETPDHFVPAPPPGPPPPSPPKDKMSPQEGSRIRPPPLPPATTIVPPFPTSLSGTNSGITGENPTESLRTVKHWDWMQRLFVIDSMMGDLSYSSGEWWDLIRSAVDQCYSEWLNAGPLERLRLKPQPDDRVKAWPRTERRALAMLLGALPGPLKEEIIASRRMSTDQVLYKLYITFQPGGASERTKLLQCITDSKCGSSLTDILEWIRLWRRYVQRARELQIVLPDGLVLLGALWKCTDQLSGKSPQVAYRLNLVRQHLSLDQLPTAEKILSYAEHLQAEAEDLQLSASVKPQSAVRAAAMGVPLPPSPPGISQSHLDEKPPPRKGACRYWMREKGCGKGDQCKFQHSTLDPQSNRCFNCSALGHSRRDCPLKMDPKGDPKRRVAKASRKGGFGKGEKSGVDPEQANANPPNGEQSSAAGSGDGKNLEVESGREPSNRDKVDGLLTEATTLLKTLRPEVKAVKLKRVVMADGPTGLLDGGATNALRRGTPQELASSESVVVELAHGTVELKQHPVTGTILTDHMVEPIVPLRGLIDLGFTIKWNNTGCEIKHPSRGTINCWLRNGCPVVSEAHAIGLIHDIERMETAKRIRISLGNLEGMNAEEVHEWWSHRFPEVPKRIWNYMRGQGENPCSHHLPWNRAQRRRLAQAKAIVIHLFAGEASKEWCHELPPGVEMLTVEVREGQNLHDASVWAYVWDLASSGRVVGIIGGPPCRTVSRMLERQPGPRRLRHRDGPERFGYSDLSEAQTVTRPCS